MIYLVTYSWVSGGRSGFGNAITRQDNLSLANIRAIEADIAGVGDLGKVVVLNLIPLPGGADA